ncbi:MAG: hypothetical protein GY757_10285, partial [bacterium]|nr:hypothetical protein [bacterium]
KRLLQSEFGPALQKVISQDDIALYKYNWNYSVSGNKYYNITAVPKDRIGEKNPALTLPIDLCIRFAEILATSLPLLDQWEAASRGPKGLLYPWGNTFDIDIIRLENIQTYSRWEDDESIMGLWRESREWNDDLYRIKSFGEYAKVVSPMGLKNLARFGMEWNITAKPTDWVNSRDESTRKEFRGTVFEKCMLRSLCNLNVWHGDEKRHTVESYHRSFAGTNLAMMLDPYWDGRLHPLTAKKAAAFRLVFNLNQGNNNT